MFKRSQLNVDSIDPLSDAINDLQIKTQQEIGQYPNLPIIMLIGNTGAGKSSISLALANEQLTISKGNGNKIILEGKGIQSGGKSCTRQPSVFYDSVNQLILCDCPGFEDTGGVDQEIINSFIIDYLFQAKPNSMNRFKILIVASISEIATSRGQIISSSISRAAEMLMDPEQIERGLGLVITKSEQGLSAADYVEQIDDNPHESMIKWCEFFKNHLDRVFVFPCPPRNAVGQNYQFDDRNRLLEFLKRDHLINPAHKITLSESAKRQMETLQIIHSGKVTEIIKQMFDKIATKIRKEKNSADFQIWLDLMEKMVDKNINSKNQLRDFVNENISNNGEFDSYYQQLEGFENFDSFIKRALESQTISTAIQLSIQRCLYEMIEEIKKSIYYCNVIEENNKEIEEKDRVIEDQREEQRKLITEIDGQKEQLKNNLEQRKKMMDQLNHMQEILDRQNQELVQIRNQRRSSGGGFFKCLGGWIVSVLTANPLPFFLTTVNAAAEEIQNND